ncbi:hypothetical protein B0H15DRAFT_839292, partial [Mycena belliarum]
MLLFSLPKRHLSPPGPSFNGRVAPHLPFSALSSSVSQTPPTCHPLPHGRSTPGHAFFPCAVSSLFSLLHLQTLFLPLVRNLPSRRIYDVRVNHRASMQEAVSLAGLRAAARWPGLSMPWHTAVKNPARHRPRECTRFDLRLGLLSGLDVEGCVLRLSCQ